MLDKKKQVDSRKSRALQFCEAFKRNTFYFIFFLGLLCAMLLSHLVFMVRLKSHVIRSKSGEDNTWEHIVS